MKCGYVTNNQLHLDEHIKEIHKTSKCFECKECEKIFSASGELEEHIQSDHKAVQTYQCSKCEIQFETELEWEWHMDTDHDSLETSPALKCNRCEYQTNLKNELEAHTQLEHLSLTVNIDLKEREVIKCLKCDYKCRLNIQLKKHTDLKHKDDEVEKYACKKCGFCSNFIADIWKHAFEKHPEKTNDFEQQNNENMVLTIVAEQNSVLIEEFERFKQDTKEAFGVLGDLLVETFGGIKDDTNIKCKLLNDNLSKIYNKVSKTKVKNNIIGRSRCKPPVVAAELPVASTPGPEAASRPMSSSTSKPKPPSCGPPKPTYASVTKSKAPKPISTSVASQKAKTKSIFNMKPKVLYVADPVGQTASIREVEKASRTRIKTAKAHSSANFKDSVEYNLKHPGTDEFDVVVMSAPTVDITKIDTSKLVPNANTEAFQTRAQESSKNMFRIAERALEQNPNLKKVILMEHTPRFDTPDTDPTSLKPALAKLANSTLGNLWINSSFKNRIVIGSHSLESFGGGQVHAARYVDHTTGWYDGVHLCGPTGQRDYTRSLKSILMLGLQNSLINAQGGDDHKNCPQAKYQRLMKQNPSVPTQNRFSVFNTYLGN